MLRFLLIQLLIYSYVIERLSKAQDVKTWRSTMNFNDVRNWKSGQIPCSRQKVIFRTDTPVAIFMPETLTVSEMVLPMNGELVFPENAVLNLGRNSEDNHCPNQDAEFIPTTDYWYDPQNWNITSSRAFPKKTSIRNAAVPHAFQIPCRLDEAWFPADTTFRVHVIYPTTRVSKILIGNRDSYQEYNQETFNSLIRSDTGRLLFPDLPRILISQSSCTDATGCVCGNDDYEVLPTICKFTVPCPESDCSDPLTVAGHCCPLCGVKILANYESHFRMDTLMQLFDKYLSTSKFIEVESFTSKLSDGRIQSIFVDNSEGKKLANDVAQLILNAIRSDINGPNTVGIRSVTIEKSQSWKFSGQYESYSSSGLSSGSIAALIIFTVLILMASAFYIYRRRQISGFSFARFDLRGDKIELELGTTPHGELEPEDSPSSSKPEEKIKAFDNPVYGTSANEEVCEAASSTEDTLDGKDYVENPMFMIFEDSESRKK